MIRLAVNETRALAGAVRWQHSSGWRGSTQMRWRTQIRDIRQSAGLCHHVAVPAEAFIKIQASIIEGFTRQSLKVYSSFWKLLKKKNQLTKRFHVYCNRSILRVCYYDNTCWDGCDGDTKSPGSSVLNMQVKELVLGLSTINNSFFWFSFMDTALNLLWIAQVIFYIASLNQK